MHFDLWVHLQSYVYVYVPLEKSMLANDNVFRMMIHPEIVKTIQHKNYAQTKSFIMKVLCIL